MNKSLRKCDLCENRSFKFLFKKNIYSIIKCKSCGLVTINPFPTKKELKKLYEKEYFETGKQNKGYSNYKKGINNYFDYVKKEPFIDVRLNNLLKFKNEGNLLDVGCAHGFFMDAAKKKGWDVVGVNVSSYVCNYGKKNFKLNIINKSLEDAKFPSKSFDVVTVWSYLDHSMEPTKLLKECNRILKKGGILALNISNIDSFRAIINGVNWRPIRPPEHLYYYSIDTLNKYLLKTGFGKTVYFGKGEVRLKDVIKTPDVSLSIDKVKFKFTVFQWIKLYLIGIFCFISLKTKIKNYTIGSNLDIYTRKIK